MSPPGIRASSNRPQAMSFETYQADPSNQRQPRITGGGIAAVSATQISRLCRQGLAFCGLASNTQGVEVRPATDIENPLPLAEAGHRTEIDQALHQLSTDFIKEEQRAIDPALRDAFSALQKTMNDTQDYSNMPQARALLLQMHGMEPDKVERGFERGGAVYSYRSIVGSTMAFLPLILTGIKTQQEYAKNLTFQLGMSAGYFGSVILASCAGVAVNARTLLHCTPIQDAEFDGSPYVSKELMSVNTPSYPKIQEELEASLKKATQLSTLLATTLADSNGLSEEDKKNTCMRLINEADISDKNDPGVKHYVARAQLHRAYIEGIQLQAGFQTMKVFGNLAAGWVSFFKNNPRLGIYVQLGVGLGQIVMQRVVAPADQKKLQYALLELEIMSRPLAGKNTQADDQEIRKMLRTPREVRVFNLESLTTAYITVLAQQIGDLLGMSAAEFEEYRRLLARKKNSEELTTAKTKVDEAYADIPAEVRFGIFPRLNVESPQSSEPRLFEALVADICEITASSRNDIVRLVELSRRDSDGKIAEGDGHHLDNLHTALGEKIADLSSFGQSALSGNVKLNRATERAVRRRSAQNAGFNSELAAAAFGTLSSRFSDEEILANIIDEISQQKQFIPYL